VLGEKPNINTTYTFITHWKDYKQINQRNIQWGVSAIDIAIVNLQNRIVSLRHVIPIACIAFMTVLPLIRQGLGKERTAHEKLSAKWCFKIVQTISLFTFKQKMLNRKQKTFVSI